MPDGPRCCGGRELPRAARPPYSLGETWATPGPAGSRGASRVPCAMTPADQAFWDAVDVVRDHDPRYRREAYGFVVTALSHAVRALPPERRSDPLRRHLTGLELLGAVVALARHEFGTLAPVVFRE